MPFKSKAQSDKCFATGGFGGAVDCEEWASQTDYSSLPQRLNPSRIKGGKKGRPKKYMLSFSEWLEKKEKI